MYSLTQQNYLKFTQPVKKIGKMKDYWEFKLCEEFIIKDGMCIIIILIFDLFDHVKVSHLRITLLYKQIHLSVYYDVSIHEGAVGFRSKGRRVL